MCRDAFAPSEKGSRPLTHSPPSEAERAFRLLCDAGALLSATADPEAALASLARLVAGSVADVCLVDLVTRDGPVVRLAAAHRDPALGTQAWELRRHPPDPDDAADAIAGVLRTGKALLVHEVEERWLRASVADREHRKAMRSMGVRSLLSVAIAAQGRVHGTMTLLCLDSHHRFGDGDLALVEELALAERPELILLDVMMPDLDGRDACRVLKMDRDLQATPVVLFSSAHEQDVHWQQAGADAFLAKPFGVHVLLDLVATLLDGGAR